MSIKLMTLVWDTDLPPRQKLVLLTYADHANDQGTSIYPSRRETSERTSYSEASVQRITGELEALGYLETITHGHRGSVAVRRIDVELLELAAQIAAETRESGSDRRDSGSKTPRKGIASEPPNHQEPSRTARKAAHHEPLTSCVHLWADLGDVRRCARGCGAEEAIA